MTTYWLDGELDGIFDNESFNETLSVQSVEDDDTVKCPWFQCIVIIVHCLNIRCVNEDSKWLWRKPLYMQDARLKLEEISFMIQISKLFVHTLI